MRTRWAWLVAVPVTALFGLAFATSGLLGHEPATGDPVHVENESAMVEAQARAALGISPGDCFAIADALLRLPDLAALDAEAGRLSGPGWVGARFVGSVDELATAKSEQLVASGKTTAWLLSNSPGRKHVREYVRLDLPSGRVAWQAGDVIAEAPCEPPS